MIPMLYELIRSKLQLRARWFEAGSSLLYRADSS